MMKSILIATSLLGLTCQAMAENSRCIEQYKAEAERIGREAEKAAKANPVGKDPEAQQKFMTPIHDALKAAAEKAEECERKSRSTSGSAASSKSSVPR